MQSCVVPMGLSSLGWQFADQCTVNYQNIGKIITSHCFILKAIMLNRFS